MKVQRKVKASPSAILTADIHIREDQPVCRTDDYWAAQWKKIAFLKIVQERYECPILDAGDLFDYWKPSPYLLACTIRRIPKSIYTVAGNHDLPQHNLLLLKKSGLEVVRVGTTLNVNTSCRVGDFALTSTSWGQEIPDFEKTSDRKSVLLLHQLVCQSKEFWMEAETSSTALDLLKKYPEYDLIVSGHNHQQFVVEYEGRLLVNPGSMMRMTADQVDFEPACYLWYAKSNAVERIPYPIEKGVVSRAHVEKQTQKEERFQAFVERLKDTQEMGLSFQENMENYLVENKLPERTSEMIWEAIG